MFNKYYEQSIQWIRYVILLIRINNLNKNCFSSTVKTLQNNHNNDEEMRILLMMKIGRYSTIKIVKRQQNIFQSNNNNEYKHIRT